MAQRNQRTEETVTTKKPKTRLVVREAFAHEGVYYTNDNINDAPKDVLEQRIAQGKVVEEGLPPEPEEQPK